METNIIIAAAFAIEIGLLVWLLSKLHGIETGMKAALQNIQIQIAYISGRIGLRNQDLQAATMRKLTPEEPAPPPEVIGGSEWNDFDELVDRVEKGEVEVEGIPRAG